MSVKAEDFVRVPLAEITKPRDGAMAYVDHWWVVTPQDEVLFFKRKWGSPQCNHNESITKRLGCPQIEGCRAQFVPLAFVPILWGEY